MDMSKALALVGQYTADQWGLITTAQATAAGLDSVTLYRLADAGHLEPVKRGVYASTAAPESQHRDIQAAWLALNPAVPAWKRPKLDPDGGVVSHRTAALVHEVGDIVTDGIELTVPRRRVTRDPLVKLRLRDDLTVDDVVLVDGLPVTRLVRTIEDLLADRIDASHVAAVIKDAVQEHQLDLDQLGARVGRYCRRYGVKSQDGNKLVDHLLDHIGTTRTALMRAPAGPIALPLTPELRELLLGMQRSQAAVLQPIVDQFLKTQQPSQETLTALAKQLQTPSATAALAKQVAKQLQASRLAAETLGLPARKAGPKPDEGEVQ